MLYLSRVKLIVLLLFFIWIHNAYAYLDPGTGSYVLQILIASLLGAAFAIKIFWQKILAFVKNIFSKKPGEQTNDSE